jgi:hypothetical protein
VTKNGRPATDLELTWAYDPQQDEWSPRARIPTPPDGAASAVLDGRIYVAGGGEFNSYSFGGWNQAARVIQRYDPALDRWEALDSIPFPRRALAAGVIGREICMFGGAFPLSRGDYTFPDMYCYEPESRHWRLGPSIPDAWVGPHPGGSLAGMSAVEWDGDILVFGVAITTGRSPWWFTAQAARRDFLRARRPSSPPRVTVIGAGPPTDHDVRAEPQGGGGHSQPPVWEVPTPVAGPLTFAALTAGSTTWGEACGITRDGDIRCIRGAEVQARAARPLRTSRRRSGRWG